MCLQAQSQGEPSEKHPQGDVNDDIQGFSQLAFVQKDGVHVAVVTSLTQNKVGTVHEGVVEIGGPSIRRHRVFDH